MDDCALVQAGSHDRRYGGVLYQGVYVRAGLAVEERESDGCHVLGGCYAGESLNENQPLGY